MSNENDEFSKSEDTKESYGSHSITDTDNHHYKTEESSESERKGENTFAIPVSHYTSK